MSLAPGCPRCSSPLAEKQDSWVCLEHGPITPLWRPGQASYDDLAEHLSLASRFPTLLPWPLSPGWVVTDFGCVVEPDQAARATMTSVAGASDADGVVELTIVSEEPNVGVGARCAGVDRTDPGGEVEGPPHARVRVNGHPVQLWAVSTSASDPTFDRSVFAGEAHGRWLWLVMRPASAALLLNDEWQLDDITDLGPELLDLPFGSSPPPW